MNRLVPALTSFLLFSSQPSFASPLELKTVLAAAERSNPIFAAAQREEAAARSRVSVAQSDYLPHLEADAIGTGGFPGSSSELGIGGLVGSPYRSGYAAGLLATATVWDFGRTLNSVRAAEHAALAQKAQTELTRQDVGTQASRLFFDCVRFRSQQQAWSFDYAEAAVISKEVERFVRTGQRSIVERYLSRSQLEEAQTNQADFQERLRLAEQRLQLFTKLPPVELQCPATEELNPESPPSSPSDRPNPLIVRANEQKISADASVDYAKDDFLPHLKAFAGVGALENSRVVGKQDYAVGVGLRIPLFDGLKTVHQLNAAEAEREAREQLVQAAQDDVDLTNAALDQRIDSARARLIHLKGELSLAEEGFKVAKSRYFSLQGNLVDLREALRNLMRTRSASIDAQAEYQLATTEKNIFNQKEK